MHVFVLCSLERASIYTVYLNGQERLALMWKSVMSDVDAVFQVPINTSDLGIGRSEVVISFCDPLFSVCSLAHDAVRSAACMCHGTPSLTLC